MDMNTAWFFLIGFFITGYAILDGFDLGVGVLHILTRDPHERRINVNAIGPVWDGNEVWLLAGGGSLFAVFPVVYATLLSAFYLPFILLLVSLIFRAVSLEFRNKVSSAGWQYFWDLSFGSGSLTASLLFGVMLGNLLQGMPIGKDGVFTGHFRSQLNLYPILIGLLTLTTFVMHGGIYMTLKTEGKLLERMRMHIFTSWIAFVILYSIVAVRTYFIAPFLFKDLLTTPFSWVAGTVLIVATFYIPLAVKQEKYLHAFLASSVTMACMILITGLGLFPLLVPSSIDPAYSLTLYNASAGPRTLTAMLGIALISLPLIISYTVYIHRVFRGKVVISEESHY